MADYRIESDGTDSGQVIYHKLAGTLSSPTDRYVYKIKPNVVDLGLTLQDAKKMKLQEENYFLKNAKNTPRTKLEKYGVDTATIDFIVGTPNSFDRKHKQWPVKRIELNSMTAPQFVEWLDKKLQDAGVTKVVPDDSETLNAWQRAHKTALVKDAIIDIEDNWHDKPVPKNLHERIQKYLDKKPEHSWDSALVELSKGTNHD